MRFVERQVYLVVMNTSQPRGRRILDGPVRRQQPSTPAIQTQPVTEPDERIIEDSMVIGQDNPSLLGTAAEAAPVFEYHKPRRMRWWQAPKVRKGLKIAAFMIVLAVAGAGAWLGYRTFLAAKNIISKSNGGAPALAGTVNLSQLKGEGDGRINVLLLGIGGEGHEGPNLSDTIMVTSIDPKTKDVAMLSIPRDLYVKLPAVANYGTQYSKINAANAYGGPTYAAKVISGIIGVPIHYYLVVDFSGFRQAVDAVGGVDINVPYAMYDAEFPCDSENGKNCPYSVKAGQQHMTGIQALHYARCRHGSCGGDLERAVRQQQVMTAVRAKALQLSTLTNPVKLSALIDTLGSHVKTDMQPNEISKMASIVKDLDMAKATQRVLDYGHDDSLLIDGTGMIAGAGSIELPRAGHFDYSEIQDFVKNIFVDHYITDENAVIEVQNGSGTSGVAATAVKSLKAAHYNVLDPVNADGHYTTTVIYDYTGGKKPYTINYLEQRFGVKAQKVSAPSATPAATGSAGTAGQAPEIRIILGSDYKSSQSSS